MSKINENFEIGNTNIDLGKVANSAIVEQGSNANGHYIKWENGLMICWMDITVTDQALNNAYGSLYIGSRKWYFPVQFQSNPIVICSTFLFGNGASWGSCSAANTIGTTLRGYDYFSRAAGTNCHIAATAIGYWK